MTDAEIRAELKRFENRVFEDCQTVEDHRTLNMELVEFVNRYHVTHDHLREFVESGAGEVLHMILTVKYD